MTVKIKYKLKQVLPGIFSVCIENDFDRAMVFLRAQEFYESPNPKFRGKNFRLWDYFEWYSRNRNGSFTYPHDWSGFNIPLSVLVDCYRKLEKSSEPDSKWDTVMRKIIRDISRMNTSAISKSYVIGSKTSVGETFNHEVCHALFYANEDYKKKSVSEIKNIKSTHYKIFEKNLLKMGYTRKVVKDEIQAYLMFGHKTLSFGIGVDLSARKKYSAAFHKSLKSYLKGI